MRLIYHHTCTYHQLCGSCIEGTHWLNALCDDSDSNAHSDDVSHDSDGGENDDTEVNVGDDDDDDDNASVMIVTNKVRRLGCSALQCWRLWVQQKFMVTSCAKKTKNEQKQNKTEVKVKH